jgi:hypothetical protein
MAKQNLKFGNDDLETIIELIHQFKDVFANEMPINFSEFKDKWSEYKKLFIANVPYLPKKKGIKGRPQNELKDKDGVRETLLREYVRHVNNPSSSNILTIQHRKLKDIKKIVTLVNRFHSFCYLKEIKPEEGNTAEILASLLNFEKITEEGVGSLERRQDKIIDELAKYGLLSLWVQDEKYIKNYKEQVAKLVPETKVSNSNSNHLKIYIELLFSFLVLQEGDFPALNSVKKKWAREYLNENDPLTFLYLQSYKFRSTLLDIESIPEKYHTDFRDTLYNFICSVIENKTPSFMHDSSSVSTEEGFNNWQNNLSENEKDQFILCSLLEMKEEKEVTADHELSFITGLSFEVDGDLKLARHIKFINNSSHRFLSTLYYLSNFFSTLEANRYIAKNENFDNKKDFKTFQKLLKTIPGQLRQDLRSDNHNMSFSMGTSSIVEEKINFNERMFDSCEKLFTNLCKNKSLICRYRTPEKSTIFSMIIAKALATTIFEYDSAEPRLTSDFYERLHSSISSLFIHKKLTQPKFKNIPIAYTSAKREFDKIISIEIRNFERRLKDTRIIKEAA